MAQQQGIVGYDPQTGKAVYGYDPNSGKAIFQPPTMPPIPQRGQTTGQPDLMERAVGTIADYLTGIGKSGLNTVIGGGQMLRQLPGVDAASKAIGEFELPVNPEPTNAAQKAGKLTGDVGQFFIPVAGEIGMGANAAKVANVSKNMLLTGMQGGSQNQALASGLISAALPGGAAGKGVAAALDRSAERNMAQALGATTDKAKAEAAKLAPQMLERGIKGTRGQMLAQSGRELASVGKAIEATTRQASESGGIVKGADIRAAMGSVMPKLTVEGANGVPQIVEGMQPVVKQLERLDRFVESLGADIPVDKAARIKTAWDKIVSKAGMYGPKAGASATDDAKAWAFREGASALRKALHENADLATLDKEYAFWKGLNNVLEKTELRSQSQRGTGLIASIGSVPGAVIGSQVGGSAGAGIGAIAGPIVVKLIQSPYWKTTVTAPMKTVLADALLSENSARIQSAARHILASLPAQARQEMGK